MALMAAYIWALNSELPQPAMRTLRPRHRAAASTLKLDHSPYHSNAFLLRALKKPSQYSTDRKSAKLAGSIGCLREISTGSRP